MKLLGAVLRCFYFWGFVSIMALSIGCAPTAKVPIMKPAEINLKGVNKIIVGDISGNSGRSLSELLTTRLFESDKFEVLDRENFDQITAEHKLNLSGLVNEESAPEFGEILGASALITGRSTTSYAKNSSKGDSYKDKNGKTHRSYHKEAKAKTTAVLKVLDLKTGKVIAVKNLYDESKGSDSKTDQWPPDIDLDKLKSRTLVSVTDDFMKIIAPYRVYVEVKFADAKTDEGKNGIKLAQNGLWYEALNQFQTEADKLPESSEAIYNVGVAYQYLYQFDEAIEAYNKGIGIDANEKCMEGIRSVRQMQAERRRLAEQQGAL
ncbi:CsgG/HfaB family protein [Desulfamplus magnetovallimortis]|nr:CsgG/HfaB family protein [Desulfamplus magnetovallimortis]